MGHAHHPPTHTRISIRRKRGLTSGAASSCREGGVASRGLGLLPWLRQGGEGRRAPPQRSQPSRAHTPGCLRQCSGLPGKPAAPPSLWLAPASPHWAPGTASAPGAPLPRRRAAPRTQRWRLAAATAKPVPAAPLVQLVRCILHWYVFFGSP